MNRSAAADVLVYKDSNLSQSDNHDTGPGRVSVFSARSPEKTSGNEDSAAVVQLAGDTAMLVVADGVGGLPAGEQASALVIDVLLQAATHAVRDGTDLRDAILSAIEEANQRIVDTGGGATTLAVAEIHGNAVRTYHVGDSMILVAGQRGRLKMETISHSPVGYAVESGLLSEEEAINHDERHIVSNVVGSQEMHISVGIPFNLAARDTLLIATDGLFDNVHRDEIIDMIRTGPLPRCADRLADYARKRMGDRIAPFKPDDLTFILYRPAGPPRKQG